MSITPARSSLRLAMAIIIAAVVIGAAIFASSYLGTATTETRTSTFTTTTTETFPSTETATSTQTTTVVSQRNNTLTVTSIQTTTQTVANRTIPWYGLYYLSAAPGCAVSYGVHSYPAPCFAYSGGVLFDCAAAAATPQGCTEKVNITGTSNQNFIITIWYPYNTGVPSQNCKWTESLPTPPGPDSAFAYCISVNSTSFLISEPAPGPV